MDASAPIATPPSSTPAPQAMNPPTVQVDQPPIVVSDAPVAPQTNSIAGQVVSTVAAAITPAPISTARTKEASPISSEVTGYMEAVGSDALEKEPIPPEVASWMEKVNRGETGTKLSEVVVADATASKPTGAYAATPIYVIPLGQQQLQTGLKKSVNDSIRWLAEWCKRMMKKLGPQAAYQES